MNTPYRVIANLRSAVALRDSEGHVEKAVPLSKLPQLVAGDKVMCERETGGALRVIELLPRNGVLERPDHRRQLKPLAANVTHLAIISAAPPGIDTLLIDQFCVAAERAGIDAMIVINKADLLDEAQKQQYQDVLNTYNAIGYTTAMLSAKSAESMHEFTQKLEDKTLVLVGASGVGKSSIVNALLPDLDVRVGAVSAATGLGAHTTSVTYWYEMGERTSIIDSPGVRQFSVAHLTASDVRSGYRDIAALSVACRFSDCSHTVEPKCAVLDALKEKNLAAWRYKNYCKLITEEPADKR